MKICMIYYAFANNNILLREAEALTDRGDQVDIICLGKEEEETGKEAYKDNLNIYKVQRRGHDEKGISAYLKKYTRFFILSSFLAGMLHIKRGYDVIHVTSPPDFFVFASLFPKLLGAKVILDIHDIVPEFFARKFSCNDEHLIVRVLKWIEKVSAKYSDHVITVTDIWKTTLANRSVPESKCSVLLNVPDTKIFNRANKGERPKSEKFTLLYPGNVDFGVDILVKAMRIIKGEIPSAKLEIYGHGRSLPKLMNLAEDIGVNKFINFRNNVPRGDLVKIMQSVDVGIDPMKDGVFFGEVLSGKSLEFLEMGIPVVISRTKASEYYFDDSMVTFFEPGNHEDLARAVIELYKNPRKRLDLVNNANKFNSIHNWNKYKKIYYDILDELCMKS